MAGITMSAQRLKSLAQVLDHDSAFARSRILMGKAKLGRTTRGIDRLFAKFDMERDQAEEDVRSFEVSRASVESVKGPKLVRMTKETGCRTVVVIRSAPISAQK